MKRLLIFVDLVIIIGFAAGCDLLGSGSPASSGGSFSLSAFPLTAGNSWTYAVYDSVTQSLDTVQVNILKTSNKSGVKNSQWTLQYHQLVDSTVGNVVYLSVVHRVLQTDSVEVNSSSNTLSIDFPSGFFGPEMLWPVTLSFPLSVGKKWSNTNGSYTIISKDKVQWKKGTFNNSYLIVQKISKYGDRNINTYWIAPKIGIVKINHNEQYTGVDGIADYMTNKTWTLLSYKIN